ncbi:MAG: polysaccharide biosynthesis/export family protein [Acidobacteria bacterium]|nr:polysaccharide biosynthesis/export family protein [Acidobacteriota bacterium]MBI3483559.1 polysaccharide biosynthesis/export family protein [Acidobacteriota bacterium]
MRTNNREWMLLAAALLLPLGGLSAQEKTNPKESKAPAHAAVEQTAAPKAATEDPAYEIGAEDQLNISVWNEPNVTRIVPVRPDGKISLPLINDVQAAGLTPMQLAMSISEKLKKFIADPQVTVIVMAINSRRYYIVGEMTRAGAFPLMPNMTVLQALSSAGGFSQFANLKAIYVLRIVEGKSVKFPFNYKQVIKGNHPEQNIVLKPGDTIVVP